jgi:ATP-dependent DNA helicase RecG
VEKTVEKTVEKIFSLIKTNPQITQKEIMEKTELTRRGIEWNLKKLRNQGRIRRVGPDKGGHWEVIK